MKKIIITALLFAFSQTSMATLFSYTDNTANNGGMSDQLETINSTFDSITDEFTWDVTFNQDPSDVDGFWLVVNDGPNNPKGEDGLALIYGDKDLGKYFVYEYNGQNNSNSWKTGNQLGTGDLNWGSDNSFSLALDATDINNTASGPGISFGEQIGIWFHVSIDSNFGYNADCPNLATEKCIVSYDYAKQGWYDKNGQDTTVVPEPSIIALFGLGLVGLGFARRKVRS